MEQVIWSVILIPWSDGEGMIWFATITSWRTIIGNNPSEITMSTLTLNSNEPNKIEDTSWINLGKYIGVWWEMIGTNQSSWGLWTLTMEQRLIRL